MRQIGDKVFYHWHMRQRINFDSSPVFDFVHPVDTGQCVDPVDVHRAGATNPFAARAAERERRVDLVFDLDERIEDHRTAVVHIHEIRVNAGVFPIVRVPAIDIKLAKVGRTFWLGPCFARRNAAIHGKFELCHPFSPLGGQEAS